MFFDHHLRLEPHQPDYDPDRGIQAEIGDPLWFLGRQWQMGEHQGEDASSPVRVEAWVAERPIDPFEGDPDRDPRIVPPEAIIEAEPDDWWTIGRRIRYGERFRAHVDAANLPEECYLRRPEDGSRAYGTDLPAPYEQFSSAADGKDFLDGRELWKNRGLVGIPVGQFPEIPADKPDDRWQPDQLSYSTQFTCDGHTLSVARHAGGPVDWYTVDGDEPFPRRDLAGLPPNVTAFPGQLTYPGVPNARYWQIEDAHVDIGGYPPDRSHFPSMLLTDLMSSHGTQWFLFPIGTQPGCALTIERVVVTDGFGDTYSSDDLPELRPPTDWSLFRLFLAKGNDFNTLVVWPTALTPLAGAALEEVALGIDEYSNLLWAVERRVNSRAIRTPSIQERSLVPSKPPVKPVNKPEQEYAYLPSVDAVPYWHPYVLDQFGTQRRFIQGTLVDYSGPQAVLMQPAAGARVLIDPHLAAPDPVHVIDPAAVPVDGLALERRWMLARDVNGEPVLWVQRQRKPLLSPPGRHLRFDVMEKALGV